MKNIFIILVVLILIGGGYYWVKNTQDNTQKYKAEQTEKTATSTKGSGVDDGAVSDVSAPDTSVEEGTSSDVSVADAPYASDETIGTSVDGNTIKAYHFGNGPDELLFVGGLHGGYEWNTSLVAYSLIDYLGKSPDRVASNLRVTVIPTMNPDGLAKVTNNKTGRFSSADVTEVKEDLIAGRFNEHAVDLNRNFDCNWKEEGVWKEKKVSGGSAPFSEPESQALRDYVESHSIKATVVWYSSAGGVFASQCGNGILPETETIMNIYAKASGYPAHDSFDYYAITGDATNWLAKKNIPAISVLLTTHDSPEWERNKAGIDAFIAHYAK